MSSMSVCGPFLFGTFALTYSWLKFSLKSRCGNSHYSDIVTNLGVVPHPEGGYFIETYRSGSQPMKSRGLTDDSGETIPTDREGSARNVMTSIIFMATSDAPVLYFGVNKSDHVHFYHGGGSYTYIVIEEDGRVSEVTLGPDVESGERLQIIFPSGCFKAGYLNGDHCIIGEGVAPGFDFRDFTFVDEELLEKRLLSQQLFDKYVKFIKPDRRRNFHDYYAAAR